MILQDDYGDIDDGIDAVRNEMSGEKIIPDGIWQEKLISGAHLRQNEREKGYRRLMSSKHCRRLRSGTRSRYVGINAVSPANRVDVHLPKLASGAQRTRRCGLALG
jgi:hypothetical protein